MGLLPLLSVPVPTSGPRKGMWVVPEPPEIEKVWEQLEQGYAARTTSIAAIDHGYT
jgi:hypothetical protein